MTLQNHIGDTEFPVRARVRYARSIDQWRRQLPGPNAVRALLILAAALPVGALGLAVALTFWPDGVELGNPFFGGVAGFVIGILAASTLFSRWDAGAMRRAQRAYLAATGAAEISPAQQQILALDASSDYAIGGWNSSLAFAFAWVELPATIRAKWADGQKGTPWPVLPQTPLAQLRTGLDREYKIASANDVEMMVVDLLARGPLSAQFEEVAASPQAEAMASRVSAIAGVTVFDVRELAAPSGDREPELLLAGDVERVLGAVRYSYLAGYLPAERAWELLARVAEKAFTRYRSYDDYWNAVAVATAFRTDSLEHVEKLRANLAGLRENGWPAASVAYPASERAVDPSGAAS